MSSAALPRDVSVQLNERHICLKCGERFTEFNNIGRLRCTQTYYLYDRQFTVAADHMAPDSSVGEQRRATPEELRSASCLYVYDEDNDFLVDDRYYSLLPTPDDRALVIAVDENEHEDQESRTNNAQYHMKHLLRTDGDEHLHPSIRRAMQMCDDVTDDVSSIEESDSNSEDDEVEDLRAWNDNFESFTKRYRIRRYDWRREADIMAFEVPKAKLAYEKRALDSGIKRIPIENTKYRYHPEYVLRARGLMFY